MTRVYEHKDETDNDTVLNCPQCKKLTVYIELPMTGPSVPSENEITCKVCRECGGTVYWVPGIPKRKDVNVYTKVFRANP
jgi:transcription elongation factor Elf1